MTFKHKLSRRLALLKDRGALIATAVLAAAVVVACEEPLQITDSSTGTVSRIVVSPKALTLRQNQTTDFTAVGLTSTGETAPMAVSWSVTSGTITDTSTSNGKHYGRYKAGSDTGKVKVVAKGNPGGPSDTATVSVTLAPVASVTVSPASASAQVGQTVQLSATTTDSAGNVLSGRAVTWASSSPPVATASSSGLVTAVAAGSATITATSEGQSGSSALTVTQAPVASVAVSPAVASMLVGATGQLSATPKDANGNALTGRVVTWASSNAATASVNGSGLVTAVAAGAVTITATSEGQSGSSAITASTVPVASVAVSPPSVGILVGQTVQLTATPKDANGNALIGRVVTWASSNAAVAGVNGSGLVTSVAAGSATITATSEGRNGSSVITVTPVPVASVAVSPAAASIQVGQTAQLIATPKDANGNPLSSRTMTWSSGNTTVATVSSSGLVTGKVAGSATITATSEGQSGTAAVTVSDIPVASVVVSPASASVAVGATQQLSAVVKDANGNVLSGRSVSWASSAPGVATVSSGGLVAGVAAGAATITASSEGTSGTAAITVVAPSCVTSAGAWGSRSLPSQTGAFEVQFDATPAAASMDGVVGLSSGPAADWANLVAIVRFNPAGTIDARDGGAYAAAAAIPYAAGTTYHFRLDVDIPSHVYDIYVTPAGAGEQLLGRNFAFRTEQSAVSALDDLGLYAVVGSETVCDVAISPWTPPPPAPVASVTVSPASASVVVGSTQQLNAVVTDANGNVLAGRPVTWASSALGVAVVSASGLVSGLAVGTATITATSEGQTGSVAISVVTATGTGKHYYVAPTGSDANPCSTAAPCYTMQRVSQLLAPGDIAHFAPGNYTWTYSGNKVTKSGTASARITYISDTKWGAKIYGSGCDAIWNEGDYVDIIGFDLTGNCSSGMTTIGNYSRVIGNRVHDLPGTGGWGGIMGGCCGNDRTGIQIIGNVVDNIGPWGQTNVIHGIYLASRYGRVENNIVTRASAAGITTYHVATNEIIANNVVANNGRYGIQISAEPGVATNDYTTVVNNIVVNGGNYGIQEYPAVGTHNVYNNNIVYNNPQNFSLVGGTQSGTITLTSAQFSALFVNYTGDMTGDYHLRSGAVAIDAGTTSCAAGVSLCVPLLDFDGIARPKGPAYDIGAYEH